MHLLDLEQDQTGNGVKAVFWGEGATGGCSFIRKLSWDKIYKEILETVWLELLSLPVEKLGWLSRLETRQRKSLTSGQRLNYLNCNPLLTLVFLISLYFIWILPIILIYTSSFIS